MKHYFMNIPSFLTFIKQMKGFKATIMTYHFKKRLVYTELQKTWCSNIFTFLKKLMRNSALNLKLT